MAEKITRTNQSADKIFDVIETMVRYGSPMRLNDIAKASGLPQSTAFRMTNALRERGYVVQDTSSGKYALSMKFTLLGDMVRAKFDLRDLVHPYMVELAERCRNICYLAVARQRELVYIDMVSPPGSALMRMPFIGKHVPLHCGGIGMVILSDYSEARLEDYFNNMQCSSLTAKTSNDPAVLRQRIQRIRELGYGFLTEQLEAGNGSVAVGLRDYMGNVAAGLSIGGPVECLTDAYIKEILPHLLAAADEISVKWGYRAI